MGLFTTAFRELRFKVSETPPVEWSKMLGYADDGTGIDLTEESSLQIAAVYACVRNIAEDEATLPLILYRRLPGGGKERATEHPLYELLHNLPNPEMTSVDLRQTLTAHLGSWGNAYAHIITDGNGRMVELWPLRPDRMEITRNPRGELIYRYSFDAGGIIYVFQREQILHLRGFGGDGMTGYSPVYQAMSAMGLAKAAERFGARFYGNGARPGVVLKHPNTLSDAAYKHLEESWVQRHEGIDKAHRVAILEEGMSMETIGIPPDEAQFLETRKFQVTEIARMYRMPPHMIGDLERATFSNIEQQSLEYVVRTLRPWLVRWEQEIYRSLLLPRERGVFFAEHLVDGLLRGDTLARYQAYASAVTNGWMNRNEIRERENMNPFDGGDQYLIPMNMMPAGGGEPQVDADGEDETQITAEENGTRINTEKHGSEEREKPIKSTEAEITWTEERARKVQGRYRLMRSYRRVFRTLEERIIKREAQDVGAAVKRFYGRSSDLTPQPPSRNGNGEERRDGKRADGIGLETWVQSYYQEHEEFMKRQMIPVAQAYAELVGQATEEELKSETDQARLEGFVRAYVQEYARRHAIKSQELINNAIQRAQRDGTDAVKALEIELARWEEERPESIAESEAVRQGNGYFKFLAGLAGRQVLRWYTMGDNTCPFCTRLNGMIVSIETPFVSANSDLEGDEESGPMKISHDIGHPPIHDGCQCMIGAG